MSKSIFNFFRPQRRRAIRIKEVAFRISEAKEKGLHHLGVQEWRDDNLKMAYFYFDQSHDIFVAFVKNLPSSRKMEDLATLCDTLLEHGTGRATVSKMLEQAQVDTTLVEIERWSIRQALGGKKDRQDTSYRSATRKM